MAEFSGGNEKLVRENEPIVFDNKTDSSFDVSMGVIFHKSGMYEVSIVGNKTTVSNVTERKRGEWIDCTEDGYVECPFCHSATNCDGNKEELHFCPSCGADMRGE